MLIGWEHSQAVAETACLSPLEKLWVWSKHSSYSAAPVKQRAERLPFCGIIQGDYHYSSWNKIGGRFAVLREKLYRLLSSGASVCFNLLNVLLGGNLPPFGSVCVVIREGERYLLLERSNGKVTLPGGFMRWREAPLETARRECLEETGLEVRVGDLTGCFSFPSETWMRMSTLTMVYAAEITAGQPRQALEGRPGWFLAEEARQVLDTGYQGLFEGYLRYYELHPLPVPAPEQRNGP